MNYHNDVIMEMSARVAMEMGRLVTLVDASTIGEEGERVTTAIFDLAPIETRGAGLMYERRAEVWVEKSNRAAGNRSAAAGLVVATRFVRPGEEE
jgi:hypothetical protein